MFISLIRLNLRKIVHSIFFNLSHMPPTGAKNGDDGTNLIGVSVLSVGDNLLFFSNFTIASFDCMRYVATEIISFCTSYISFSDHSFIFYDSISPQLFSIISINLSSIVSTVSNIILVLPKVLLSVLSTTIVTHSCWFSPLLSLEC